MTPVRLLLAAYVREHGPVALLAEGLAMLTVFALIGAAFAFPAAVADPAAAPPATDGAGMGAGR